MDRIVDRVRAHTAPYVNERIDRMTRGTIQEYARREPADLVRRLAELDREWDVDRAIMALFPLVGGVVLHLGMTRDRRWLHLLRAQLGFLLLHAAAGWCPPVSLLRRQAFRTRAEIEEEKQAIRRILASARMATSKAAAR